jgi:hypothetical protein
MTNIHFKIIAYESDEYRDAVRLRDKILKKPVGLTLLLEELKEEKEYMHIAGFNGNKVISTAILIPEDDTCKMRQVAIETSFQGSGIDSHMMNFCENEA